MELGEGERDGNGAILVVGVVGIVCDAGDASPLATELLVGNRVDDVSSNGTQASVEGSEPLSSLR